MTDNEKGILIKIIDIFASGQSKEPGISWGISRSSSGKWKLWCAKDGEYRDEVEDMNLGLVCIKLGQDMQERGLVKFNVDPKAN